MPEIPVTGQPAARQGAALLSVDDVSIQFGGLKALDHVSFDVREGEILGLIGPNGAGKTTCFNVMTGVYQPTSGEVRFAGSPLGRRKRFAITRLGIARTFQNIRLFGNMTALENVLVGADAHHRTNVIDALVRSPRHRREEREGEETAREVMRFLGLERMGDELARNLSYGDQRRLEIARALATDPKLLLLSILFVAAVVVGGAGNRYGVILGAIVVAYLPERFRGFEEWRLLVFGVALLLLSNFRPQGLLPPRRSVRAKPADVETEVLEEGATHA